MMGIVSGRNAVRYFVIIIKKNQPLFDVKIEYYKFKKRYNLYNAVIDYVNTTIDGRKLGTTNDKTTETVAVVNITYRSGGRINRSTTKKILRKLYN